MPFCLPRCLTCTTSSRGSVAGRNRGEPARCGEPARGEPPACGDPGAAAGPSGRSCSLPAGVMHRDELCKEVAGSVQPRRAFPSEGQQAEIKRGAAHRHPRKPVPPFSPFTCVTKSCSTDVILPAVSAGSVHGCLDFWQLYGYGSMLQSCLTRATPFGAPPARQLAQHG